MADEPKTPTEASNKPYKIMYYRSHLHRHIPADGCWLGLNGVGQIIVNFFSDSPALPKQLIGETTPDGKTFTTKEPQITYEDAEAIRIFEISVTMPLVAARQLRETIGNFIKLAEETEKAKLQAVKTI